MTIEVTNTSGQLVPATEINSLLTFALLELELNPECEVNVSFVDDVKHSNGSNLFSVWHSSLKFKFYKLLMYSRE